MIIYSVTVTVHPEIDSEWLAWMRQNHIPNLLRTGCFLEARVSRALESPPNEKAYVMHYHCRSLKDYQRYCAKFARRLQQEHTDRFAGHFRASRQILEEVERVRASRLRRWTRLRVA